MYQIIPIQAQHDADMCRIIQQVGAQYGAVGEGFGPVRCMAAVMRGCLRIPHLISSTGVRYTADYLQTETVNSPCALIDL